jgi:MOSC domain-containing protein YiiM
VTGAVPPARVLAVSAAVPTLHQIDGRPVLTSIVRTPLSGTLQIGANGPLNSQTAVHTEHVLAFAAANYDHWSAYLGVARWPWSDWGETLTLDLLDERALRIGDRLRVGAELVLEVTSPRLPCFKLAWRINQPVSVLVPMARDGRVGVYLRVVPPGPVQAGDPVHHEPAAQPGITVAALSSLLSREDSDDLAA